MKTLKIILWVIVALILFPKPYTIVGGLTGKLPGPWKCFGWHYSIFAGNYPDAQTYLYCTGITYR